MHPPMSKVGFFVFTQPMNEATKQNKEANLAGRWVRRDLS